MLLLKLVKFRKSEKREGRGGGNKLNGVSLLLTDLPPNGSRTLSKKTNPPLKKNLNCDKKDYWLNEIVNELINEEGVCRKAPATPGLLNTKTDGTSLRGSSVKTSSSLARYLLLLLPFYQKPVVDDFTKVQVQNVPMDLSHFGSLMIS